MSELFTKPYLIRAIYDWCADSGYSTYLAVRVDEHTRVPVAFIKDGEIVLNLSVDAVRNLHMGNDQITCGGRFGGVPHEIVVPITAVIGIFAKETGQGLVFQGQESSPTASKSNDEDSPPPGDGAPTPRPRLRVVK